MMNCKTCENLESNINWRKDSFSNIKRIINSEVSGGCLEELGEASPGSPFLVVRYRCNNCGTTWRLTHPDQAFTGGFEKENKGEIAK